MLVIKLLVAFASGISLALVAGVTLHVISGGNDAVAYVGAAATAGLSVYSLRADV